MKTSLHSASGRLLLTTFSVMLWASVVVSQTTNSPPMLNPPPGAAEPSPFVKLNVIVTDAAGHSGLEIKKEELSIIEDGVPQTISYFAKEDWPVSYALLMDNSGSLRFLMGTIVSTGVALVSANRVGDETLLVRFVSSDKIETVQDFTASSELLNKGLSSLYVEGGNTALNDAVYLTAQRVANQKPDDAKRRRALVLVSDGEDRSSYYKQEELIKLLRRVNVQVFAVAFVHELDNRQGSPRSAQREKAIKLIDALTEETGGRAFYPKKPEDLKAALNEIARDLGTQYVVGYRPANPLPADKYRKVQIKVADAPNNKRHAVARAGYYLEPPAVKEKPAQKK
ncbi:MAG: VWA domain-containing protein [Acidobacteriota bacterium]|nr:VWA domain-containing protein [Acidobacteriota bacterium]